MQIRTLVWISFVHLCACLSLPGQLSGAHLLAGGEAFPQVTAPQRHPAPKIGIISDKQPSLELYSLHESLVFHPQNLYILYNLWLYSAQCIHYMDTSGFEALMLNQAC